MVRLAVEMGYLEEIERLTERCAAYKGQVEAGSHEIKRLRASQERLKSAIEFAHSEGFEWPSDPMAEFVVNQQERNAK